MKNDMIISTLILVCSLIFFIWSYLLDRDSLSIENKIINFSIENKEVQIKVTQDDNVLQEKKGRDKKKFEEKKEILRKQVIVKKLEYDYLGIDSLGLTKKVLSFAHTPLDIYNNEIKEIDEKVYPGEIELYDKKGDKKYSIFIKYPYVKNIENERNQIIKLIKYNGEKETIKNFCFGENQACKETKVLTNKRFKFVLSNPISNTYDGYEKVYESTDTTQMYKKVSVYYINKNNNNNNNNNNNKLFWEKEFNRETGFLYEVYYGSNNGKVLFFGGDMTFPKYYHRDFGFGLSKFVLYNIIEDDENKYFLGKTENSRYGYEMKPNNVFLLNNKGDVIFIKNFASGYIDNVKYHFTKNGFVVDGVKYYFDEI